MINYLSTISQSFLFLLLFLFIFNKLEIEKEKRVIVAYICFTFLFEILMIVSHHKRLVNMTLSHFYFPIEFFLLYFILYGFVKKYRLYWKISGGIIGIFLLAESFILVEFSKVPALAMSVQGFFLLLFSAWIVIELTTMNFIPFYKDENFYFASGILLYTSISSAMFVFFNFFRIRLPFDLAIISAVGSNLIFSVGVIIYYTRRKMLKKILADLK